MNSVAIILAIACGIICLFIHKSKGYSPIAGFLWGFIFSIIGLAVVFFERSKEEVERSGKKNLSVIQYVMLFIGIGILLLILLTVLSFI